MIKSNLSDETESDLKSTPMGSPREEKRYIRVEETRIKRRIIKRSEIDLQDLEFKGEYTLEADSVYGAVIAIPQIARSAEWNRTMVALTFRVMTLLVLNYFLQGSAMMYIGEASQVMEVLAGKMHLCDFAYDLQNCPHDKHCTGPGGTLYQKDNLYSFDMWSTRSYMRDSLKAILKGSRLNDLAEDVDHKFVPGEYGMENYWCRLLACFIFMLNEMRDFFKTWELIMVLIKVPTLPESWIYIHETEEAMKDPLESTKFKIAGVPWGWKLIYFLIVVIPKSFLLYNVCWMGLRFLMETAGIQDLVLGAMTMDFILTLDEVIFHALGSKASKHIMLNLGSYEYDGTNMEDFLDNERSGGMKGKWGAVKLSMPTKLLFTLAVLVIFELRYYWENCEMVDGMFVSKPMHMPKSSYYDFMTFVKGQVESEPDAYWSMPGTDDL